ncbi:MAG: SPOR domain-containing protein [Lachnospiraceae bacterium]
MGLTGKTNEERIWNFLKGKGLSDHGVAGLMGNLYAESALNPHNLQNTYEKKLGYTDDAYTAAVDSGDYANFVRDSAGYGLAQWTYWSRKEALLAYAKAAGASVGDLATQLGFLYKELSEGYAGVLDTLKTATSVRQASDAVLLKYERPANQSETVKQKRAGFGEKYLKKYAAESKPGKEGNNTSNSSLVDCTRYSPNHSGKRTHAIDTLTPHCVVGQLSAETIGDCFPEGREASCNYGIGYDGRVCLIVDECNRSWCSSSNSNDQRAITIECASDKTAPYAMKPAVYEKLIQLCADICKRNGKTKVLWLGSKEKTLAYTPKSNEVVLTAHRWFANKSCPGDWLYSRYGELANKINALLGSGSSGGSGNAGGSGNSGGSGSVLYYVQSGAYKQKANADAQAKKLKSAGHDVLVKLVDGYYKVQTGAYSKKANADAELAKLKAQGFDAFITTNGGSNDNGSNDSFKVGDKVKCNAGVTTYSNGAKMASWVPGSVLYVRAVESGGKVLLVSTEPTKKVYTGRVKASDVHKI